MPRVQMLSLTAIGTPARAPSGCAGGPSRVHLCARAPARRSWHHGVERVQRRVHAVDARQRLAAHLDGRHAAGGDVVADAAGRGHRRPQPPITRGTRKSPASPVGVGRVGDGLLRRERRPRLVGALRVHERPARGRWLARPVGVHGLQLLSEMQDVGELPGEQRLLVVAQVRDARAPRCARRRRWTGVPPVDNTARLRHITSRLGLAVSASFCPHFVRAEKT